MRRVTTCAPITGEAYASNWTNNVPEILAGLSNTSAKFYEFGKSPGDQGCDATNVTTDTTTFCVTKYQKQNIQTPYTIRATTAYDDNKNASDFSPIQDFQVANSDVTLISILNQAKYAGNSTDPLFKALNETSTNSQFYTAANDLSFLGCTEQYQFCNRGNGRCTNLTGLYGMKESIDKGVLALSAKQQAIYTVMWKAAWAMSMQWAITILSDDILLARDWVFTAKSQSSSPLPPDQWILESYNLHNLSLAVFQRRVNEYASPENFEIKPGVSSLDKIIRQEDPNLAALCNLQKIRSTTHMSFSILGMVIILVVGSVLVLLDWFLVQYIFWFRAMTHRRLAKKEDWTQGGTLILHKQVLEARGIGPWNTQDWAFPTLTKRFLTFSPTEAESEASMPLDQGQGMSSDDQSTAYDRGKHTAMPQHSSVAETYSFSEDKTSH
ncbi:hypothetical protein BDV96DRAFT_482825 [Lophiotrema nucula]|uniref:Uncharacterized protein n=1 Tax=Lophiotrema nucula TaxID=690887 RepID=A0A6A5ZS59_9PLEO|nr:hypothetical protein BDV96DRAFT_482825 [Lophiotrema nucula]